MTQDTAPVSLANRFSIATFNLCNLQLPGREMFGEFAWTQNQYGKKLQWTAERFATLAKTAHPLDLFCLQELWDGRCLDDVLARADLAADYQTVCFQPDDGETPDMAVAACVHRRWQISEASWIRAFPEGLDWRSDDPRYRMTMGIDRFSRPVLKLRLHREVLGKRRDLCVFIVHLKSRRPISPGAGGDYFGAGPDAWLDIGRALSGSRRLAEAAALRMLANRQLAASQDAVIIAGDCNDRYPSNVLDILCGDARYRRHGNNRSGRRADWGLYHLLQLQAQASTGSQAAPPRDYITFYGDDEQLALDHLLFSWHFHSRAAGHHWRLHDWQCDSQHLGLGKPHTSDHAVLSAIFDMG